MGLYEQHCQLEERAAMWKILAQAKPVCFTVYFHLSQKMGKSFIYLSFELTSSDSCYIRAIFYKLYLIMVNTKKEFQGK